MPINGPTTGSANALKDTDFEADAFAHGPLLQPIVKVDATAALDGTGSTANPLEVVISADAGNNVSFGTDGGLFLDASANVPVNDTAAFSDTEYDNFSGVPVDVSSIGTFGPYNESTTIINNPSAVLPMRLIESYRVGFLYSILITQVLLWDFEVQRDGGGWTVMPGILPGIVPSGASNGIGGISSARGEGLFRWLFDMHIASSEVAASGSTTIETRFNFETLNNVATTAELYELYTIMNFIGIAV